jgi:ABC-type Fe3+ transport system substrate-binding protein
MAAEWIAKGKYPILIGPREEAAVLFRRAGAPVGFVMPREGSYTTCGPGALSLVNRAPHPNAASLFVNCLLTKEGQTINSKAMGTQSARIDVPADFVDPDFVLEPGVRFFPTVSEEFARKKGKYQQLAKELFNIP